MIDIQTYIDTSYKHIHIRPLDADSIVGFDSFSALNLSKSGSFRALNMSLFENLRVIRC